ncbi:hypothetical protein PP715_09570 [Ralstonia solanacearum]|uniref:Uncharacterized protein n=2 Tax=Ralstonia solanacearum TaxID=305 RepID=A0A5H2PZE4_RALSL|nr:hypothetical protein [Ralstonia solanacearum]AEG68429.1 conserved hypothetical protein [Ralstonia solanacearum Po82]AMP69703.1 hypothetical protein UW163_09565 [Ralstonia solanacearum]AMP73389.1 hypothetical protein RALBFv3_04095 [Ralstonia solanacearum]AYB60085.1 hypothetical protein C2124_05490 [Ralstonia solanacearum]MCG3576771.1 hypothetical protein [Ralstonia solanacearum]
MSRSSTDGLAIGLGASALALGRRRSAQARFAERLQAALGAWAAPRLQPAAAPAGVAPADVAPEETTTAAPADAAPAAPDLIIEIDAAQRYTEAGALDALRRALASGAPESASRGGGRDVRARRRAAIVLDDFWGNHAIVRGDFRTLHAGDAGEIVRAYFADVFGADASAWSIQWQLREDGRALFASALSRTLHDGIHAACSAEGVEIASLTLGLQHMLNRMRRTVAGREGLLLVIGETMLHAVSIENGRWCAYDAQRVFAGDGGAAVPLAEVARHVFERSPALRHDDCEVYLYGAGADPAQFDRYFDHVHLLQDPASAQAPARRLMEFAQ